MFLGEYNYKLDEKGRVPVPPKFRGELRDGIILVPGPEKCIIAYTPEEWKKLSENLHTGALASNKMRKLNRALFSTAFHLNLDATVNRLRPNVSRMIPGDWGKAESGWLA
jgi:MraZ protein